MCHSLGRTAASLTGNLSSGSWWRPEATTHLSSAPVLSYVRCSESGLAGGCGSGETNRIYRICATIDCCTHVRRLIHRAIFQSLSASRSLLAGLKYGLQHPTAMTVDIDPTTQANYTKIASQQVHFDWTIDWAKQVISGSVTHTLVVREDSVSEVVYACMH